MKKVISILLALILVVGLMAGCAGGETNTDTPTDAPKTEGTSDTPVDNDANGKVLKVGISWAHYNDALFYAWGDGIKAVLEAGAPEHGYDSVQIVSLVAEDDASKQASDISDLVTQGCDVIIGYLSKLFHNYIGMPLHSYVLRYRLERAQQLISSGKANITEAAMKCGFSSIHTFSKAFKKKRGMNPSAYAEIEESSKKEQQQKLDYDPEKLIYFNQ